jgi:hypothetical protein
MQNSMQFLWPIDVGISHADRNGDYFVSASMRDIPAKPVQGQPLARLALAWTHTGSGPR